MRSYRSDWRHRRRKIHGIPGFRGGGGVVDGDVISARWCGWHRRSGRAGGALRRRHPASGRCAEPSCRAGGDRVRRRGPPAAAERIVHPLAAPAPVGADRRRRPGRGDRRGHSPLVESQMASMFPLVVIVHADPEARVRRLIEYRGFSEDDARARDRGPGHRRATTTAGGRRPAGQHRQRGRIGRTSPRPLVPPHPAVLPQPATATRPRPDRPACCRPGVGRPGAAHHRPAQHRLRTPAQPASTTSVPPRSPAWTPAISSTSRSPSPPWRPPTTSPAICCGGYPRVGSITADHRYDGSTGCGPRFHASGIPAGPTHVHIRIDGEPNQRFALLFVDRLAANPAARADYLAVNGPVNPGCGRPLVPRGLSAGLGVGRRGRVVAAPVS